MTTVVIVIGILAGYVTSHAFATCKPFKITFEYCSSNMVFRILYGKSLSECAFECDVRPSCDAINYRKRRLQCELLAADNSTSLVPSSVQIGQCVYIHRSDIYINGLSEFCGNSCTSGEVCDTELRKCIIKECNLLSLANGTIWGNMYTIGSRLKIKCNEGYVEVGNNMYTNCDTSGQWNPAVQCQSTVNDQAPAPEFNCTFESSICTWTQANDDAFDWTRRYGETPSDDTGPSVDHTLGNSNGYYIYIEATGSALNDKARLVSPPVNTTTPKCLHFWYHMYGINVNMLNVYLQVGNTLGNPVWTQTGTLLDEWYNATVDIQKNSEYNIVFEGVTGTSFRGDIALDDLSVWDGSCTGGIT